MASRRLEDLRPDVAEKVRAWIWGCAQRGVDVLVYCTLRTADEQGDLYARGRSAPGKIVTNAPPWSSWHQYGRAVDAVPLIHGKPDWSFDPAEPHWQVFANEAAKAGLEWAGLWETFAEYVHVQDTGGTTIAEAYRDATGLEMTA